MNSLLNGQSANKTLWKSDGNPFYQDWKCFSITALTSLLASKPTNSSTAVRRAWAMEKRVMDDITAEKVRMEGYLDDNLIYDASLEEQWWRAIDYLELAVKNGIVIATQRSFNLPNFS